MKTIIASGRNGGSNDLSFSSSASDLDSLATEIEHVEAVASELVLHPDVVEYLLPPEEESLRKNVLVNPVQTLTLCELEVLQITYSVPSKRKLQDCRLNAKKAQRHIESGTGT